MICKMCSMTPMIFMATIDLGHQPVDLYYCPKCDRANDNRYRTPR